MYFAWCNSCNARADFPTVYISYKCLNAILKWDFTGLTDAYYYYYFWLFFWPSKDRIPFLLHDHESDILRRTTDVKRRNFQNKNFSLSTNWTWDELRSLNAGEWFLEVRAALYTCMSTRLLLKVYVFSLSVLQSQEVSSDFSDRSVPLCVQALRRGEGIIQESDYTLLTSAPRPRQGAQHLSFIWPI